MPFLRAGIDAGGRLLAVVTPVHAQIAALDTALAARHGGQLAGRRLMDEAARLVRASHHAVTATDAQMAVDHDDAVGTLEGRAGRADVDTGRMLAVLTHQRELGDASGLVVLELDLADPDGLLVLPLGLGAMRFLEIQAVFTVAGVDTGRAAVGTLGRVDQQTPAHIVRDRLAARSGRDAVQKDARSHQRGGAQSGRRADEAATPGVDSRSRGLVGHRGDAGCILVHRSPASL